MNEKERCVELARELIGGYFDSLANKDRISTDGILEAFAVKTDNDILLEHIKAWINILNDAKEELEK